MRIWSIHPKYLDAKGLVALWRETLLAKHVLEGKTKGYKNHPQLHRFKRVENPLDSISQYLATVYREALERGYKFDNSKFHQKFVPSTLEVTNGQMQYELTHLLRKLKARDIDRFHKLSNVANLDPHPLFVIVEGEIEPWEIVNITKQD